MRVWGKVTLEAILFWCQGFNSFQETEIQKLEWMAPKKKKKKQDTSCEFVNFRWVCSCCYYEINMAMGAGTKSRDIVSEKLLMSHNVKSCCFIRRFISCLYCYASYLGLLKKIQLSWMNHLEIIGRIILTWILDSFWTCELNSAGFGDDFNGWLFWDTMMDVQVP
jgi:hypothetical protein